MTEKVFLHITMKIVQILRKERAFFEKSKADRKALCEKLDEPMQKYLCDVSEEQFLQDLATTFKVIQGKEPVRKPQNGFGDVFAGYIVNKLGPSLDRIPLSFYTKGHQERQKELDNLKFPAVLKDALMGTNHQSAMDSLFGFLKRYDPDTPTIIIQSARDTDTRTKHEMREAFQAKYPNSFPIFQVAKYLLGGMRVFVDGQVTDESWVGKIERFTTSLTPSN